MRFVLPLSITLLAIAAIFYVETLQPLNAAPDIPVSVVNATSSLQAQAATSTFKIATSTSVSTSTKQQPLTQATSTLKKPVSKPIIKPVETAPVTVQVVQDESPYATPAQSFSSIDTLARGAIVNILCMPQSGTLRPVSGSGVIIDPRGIILTNAHVAQYVLLSESSQVDLTCLVRSGSPAAPHWKAEVLYMPPIWVDEHYKDINVDNAVGTGEHDYALLLITGDTQGNPITGALSYLPIDTREDVVNDNDRILGAGYPAEFVGGIVAQQDLYAVTSVSTVGQLFTFNTSTVDVFSIGGVIEAQGGSSGGPVVNAWGYVVGIITTTSEGATTAERDLHAVSLNYIDRDILVQTGRSFANILSDNPVQLSSDFSRETAPNLIQKYVNYLSH